MRYVVYFADSPVAAPSGGSVGGVSRTSGFGGSMSANSRGGSQANNSVSNGADMQKPESNTDNAADQEKQKRSQLDDWKKQQDKMDKSQEKSLDKVEKSVSEFGKSVSSDIIRDRKQKGRYGTGDLVREADAKSDLAAQQEDAADQLVKQSAGQPNTFSMSRRLGRWI